MGRVKAKRQDATAPQMTDHEKLIAAIRLLYNAYEVAKASGVFDLLLPILNARALVALVVGKRSNAK